MTVAEAGALVPLVPAQVSVNDVVVLRAFVSWEPLDANGPLHPPDAVQAVALVELQVRVDRPPLATDVGDASKLAVGAIAPVVTATLTVDVGLVPPAPVHVIEYAVVAVMGPVVWLPPAAKAPLQPPVAAHAVALVEAQVRVALAPAATLVGEADSVTVGAGGGVMPTVAIAAWLVPPAPVQVMEYMAAAVNAPVLCVPLGPSAPLQPPEAVQPVELVELHVRVEAPPLDTLVGAADNDTVGSGGELGAEDPPPPQACRIATAPMEAILKTLIRILPFEPLIACS